MRYGYRGGTSNVRAVRCRICGFTIEAGKGVKVWCGTDQQKRPTLGFIHRTEVQHGFTLRYRTAKYKIWYPPSQWVWHPYHRRRGRKRNPIISWIAIKLKLSPQAARAYWERHRAELITELQERVRAADPTSILATKNPEQITAEEALQLANMNRLPERIREYVRDKILGWIEQVQR